MFYVPWDEDVNYNDIKELHNDEKWKSVRDRIVLINQGRNKKHQTKISRKALILRELLLSLDIDVFPALFRTYEINKGQGQWSWEVLSWNLNGLGSYEPFKDILKTGYMSVTSRGNDIFSSTKETYENMRNFPGRRAVHFELNKGKVKILETVIR